MSEQVSEPFEGSRSERARGGLALILTLGVITFLTVYACLTPGSAHGATQFFGIRAVTAERHLRPFHIGGRRFLQQTEGSGSGNSTPGTNLSAPPAPNAPAGGSSTPPVAPSQGSLSLGYGGLSLCFNSDGSIAASCPAPASASASASGASASTDGGASASSSGGGSAAAAAGAGGSGSAASGSPTGGSPATLIGRSPSLSPTLPVG